MAVNSQEHKLIWRNLLVKSSPYFSLFQAHRQCMRGGGSGVVMGPSACHRQVRGGTAMSGRVGTELSK
jgi:hypothetical protein